MRVVGLQPFSRPGEQAGCVLRLGKKDDFRKKVLKKIKFRQDKDIRNLLLILSETDIIYLIM